MVEVLHPLEHDVGGRLGLLARGGLDALEPDRIAVLNGHLRKPQAGPVAHLRRAVDRGGDDRHARLEGDPAHARPGLAELARARAAPLRVHHDQPALAEDRMRGLERLLVAPAAKHGEHATVREDELHRPLEELRLGHELHLPAQVDGDEEVVPEREVVGGDDGRPLHRDLVRADAAGAVEEEQDRREQDPHELVDVVGPPGAGALVKAREVLGRPGVLVDLRLH